MVNRSADKLIRLSCLPYLLIDQTFSMLTDGTAVLLMIAFHLLWDLREFSVLSFDVNNSLWQGFRSIILFMFTSALGCASFLAVSHNHSTYRFIKNQVKLALAALILSIGTLTAAPSQWIFFGILHFLFVAGWLIRPAASYPILLACAGVSLIAISAIFSYRCNNRT